MLTDPVTVTQHGSIDDLTDAKALFAGAPLYESPNWLRYCERSSGDHMTYLVARDTNGIPVGVTTVRTVQPGQVMALYDLAPALSSEASLGG